MYQCEAASVAGFIQQLAVSYITQGYRYYVSGEIPAGKSPQAVDAKLLARYGIGCSKFARCRRKRAGLANVQYLRFARRFVLVATAGQHRFFTEEARVLRDFTRDAFQFAGYSIRARLVPGGIRPSVRIASSAFKRLQAQTRLLACKGSGERLARHFQELPFEPYAPVRRQFLKLWRIAHRNRKTSGLEPVPLSVLRLRRLPVRPFTRP